MQRLLSQRKQLIFTSIWLIVLAAYIIYPSTFNFDLSFSATSDLLSTTIFQIRLPRAIVCCLVGASLGVAGQVSQGLFRNPIASPSILGTTTGGVLGAVLITFYFPSETYWSQITASFTGALLSALLVIRLSKKNAVQGSSHLLLIGFAINILLGSWNSLLLAFSVNDTIKSNAILNWMMGSFVGKSWDHVLIMLGPLTIGFTIAYKLAGKLNIINLGHELAVTHGLDWIKVRNHAVICIAILVGTSVSFAGMIPFIGLIIPHICRFIVGPDNRKLMPFCALVGMCLCLIADLLAKTLLYPIELNVGALISIIGAPWMVYLLTNKKLLATKG